MVDKVEPLTLLTLPLEIRQLIYRHLLIHTSQPLYACTWLELKPISPFLTCRELYHETISIFFSENNFAMSDSLAVYKWLRNIHPEGLEQSEDSSAHRAGLHPLSRPPAIQHAVEMPAAALNITCASRPLRHLGPECFRKYARVRVMNLGFAQLISIRLAFSITLVGFGRK